VGITGLLYLSNPDYDLFIFSSLFILSLSLFIIKNFDRIYSWIFRFLYKLKLNSKREKLKALDQYEVSKKMIPISWGILFHSLYLTLFAYIIMYIQVILLSKSIAIPVHFLITIFAFSIGSIVTLIPISISGIGTRDAAILAYLSYFGLTNDLSFGFSILIFFNFYLGCSLIGLFSWLLKPVKIPPK
jgi:uncharacterized membrane protein YbhN (UPF0104 family)